MFSRAIKVFTKDYRSIPLGIKLIVFVIFMRALGWGFVDPFYSMYLSQFHENYTIIGLFASIMSISALIAIIPLIRLADKMKEATIIEDGEVLYFFVVLSYVLAGVFKSIPLLIMTLILAGIAQSDNCVDALIASSVTVGIH